MNFFSKFKDRIDFHIFVNQGYGESMGKNGVVTGSRCHSACVVIGGQEKNSMKLFSPVDHK